MAETASVLHPDLRGRVAVVTGASRGIGKALAIRLAREGAAVTVAAKSEHSTERLPGSIHETAGEIRALGGRALAIPTDVRDEDAIRNSIERTVAEFGRLDILVNNAGAIWLQPILKTPPKRFDLMMGVNARAAYVACYYALPHMVKQQVGACAQHVSTPQRSTFTRQSCIHDVEAGDGARCTGCGGGAPAR